MYTQAARNRLRLPKPLIDISPQKLAKATEVNCEQFAIHTARSVGGQVHKESDATWVLSTQPGGANQIVSPRFKGGTTKLRLDEILTCYAEAEQFLSLNGEPLGAATLCIGGGVAGLYDVGVVKKARRQGIGTAVTGGACLFAHQLGYRVATLFASGQGKYLYPHLGFEFIGTFSHWSYSKTQQRKHKSRSDNDA